MSRYKKQQLISINGRLSEKVFVIGYWRNRLSPKFQSVHPHRSLFLFLSFFFLEKIYTARNKYTNCAKISKICVIITFISIIKNREESSNEKKLTFCEKFFPIDKWSKSISAIQK